METRQFELNLLLEQRREAVNSKRELTERAGKLLIAIIPFGATTLLSYFSIALEAYAPIIRFVMLEAIIILTMMISACLFAANIDRDYVSAVDRYIYENYNISVLFYSGELSKKHTTGFRGAFSTITTLIGANVAVLIVIMAVQFFKYDEIFYRNNRFLELFIILQLLGFVAVVILNTKRKIDKYSDVAKDCYEYLNRGKTKETA